MAAPKQLSPNQASQAKDAPVKDAPTAVKDTPIEATEEAPVKDAPAVKDAPVPVEEAPAVKDAPVKDASVKDAPTVKDAPVPEAASLKDSPAAIQQEFTYAATQASDAYLEAKKLLNQDLFDEALECIALNMTQITSVLGQDCHEALAPLYYLYGTTLLYQLEESSDIQAAPQDEEEVDDSQVAWENLETARLIVEQMNQDDNIKLDLAQIYLRLGDLQRANGRYPEAINDYNSCLELRQALLGLWDRKVAQVHHLLGVVHTMLASEQENSNEGATNTATNSAEHRTQSIVSYTECAKSIAGQIALLCNADPKEITAPPTAGAGGKTTGMTEAELAVNYASLQVRAMRERVQELTSPANQEQVEEFKEWLVELQETIDEAETSQQGVKEVAEMKEKAKAAVEGGTETVNVDGSTTTIGFGNAAATTTVGFDATATAAATTSAKPMMVVKKKKKQPEEDSKMPAQGDTKRQKTE